ncbi:MAG TPA: LacI family DNA-binding transcriptional regulator [Phycisphaeraceae bacterium]
MGVTIEDIARKLNVSASTVSRSLRQDPSINSQTRARVYSMAMKMGYQGRSRRGVRKSDQKAAKIGVLLSAESLEAAKESSATLGYLHGITAEADAARAMVTMHAVKAKDRGRMDQDPELVPLMVRERHCDAIITQGPQVASDLALIGRRLPVISLGRTYPDLQTDAVLHDNIGGIRQLVGRLVKLGHRRLAWVHTGYEDLLYQARLAGFLEGCVSHGLNLEDQRLLRQGIFSSHPPFHLLEEGKARLLKEIKQGVTAFVCVNDREVAQPVVECLEQAGIDVPGQVSVTGFDAHQHPTSGGKIITSIDPDFVEMGRLALRLAVQRAQQPWSRLVRIAPIGRFVEGDTIGPAPR